MSLLLFALLLTAPASAQSCSGLTSRTITFAPGRTAFLWTPANLTSCGKLPVAVFSHGFGGCGDQSLFFTEELARRGYLVVAPNHLDARCGERSFARPEQPFAQPEQWTEETHLSRRDDLKALLDFVLSDPTLRQSADAMRIAGVGHSLGGYSMMGIAGGWVSWTDGRYRAVLLFSPYATPYLAHGTTGQIRIPAMYQGGQLDLGVTPSLRKPGGIYDQSNAPKYYVELYRAGHFAWTNATCGEGTPQQCASENAAARLINQYGFAFLDEYVKGEPQTVLKLRRHPLLADFRSER